MHINLKVRPKLTATVWLIANNLGVLGKAYYLMGRFDDARQQFEQAVPILHAAGANPNQFVPMGQIGMLRFYAGEYEAARDYFEQALDIAKDAGDEAGVAKALTWVGKFHCALGDYPTAQSYIGQALGIQKELGHRSGEANSLCHFAQIYYNTGDNRIAKRYCDMALEILEEVKTPEIACQVNTYLGHALTKMDKLQGAANAYQRVLDSCQNIGNRIFSVNAMTGLAAVNLAQQELEKASTLVDDVVLLLDNGRITGIEEPFWVYLNTYHILKAIGKYSAAKKFAECSLPDLTTLYP